MEISLVNRRRWRILRFYCIGWTFAFLFLSVVRGVGTQELGSLQFGLVSSLLISITLGPLMGLVSGAAQIVTEETIYKRIPIQRFLLVRFLISIVLTLLLIFLAYQVYQFFFETSLDIRSFAADRGTGAIYFYVVTVDFFLSVLRQVNLLLGEGNLRKLMLGKFYTPREEQRIFMFLDLQSSTELAERLGHIKYSMLVQDCFNDLGIAAANEAEIYQYVGDEAVLTWPTKDGIKNQNCLRAFYNFRDLLKSKSEHYRKKYNCAPFFKAGLHAGVVTVTEVGKYKKEIAYHGDAINTAARIQGQCNMYNEELLLSEVLKDQLDSEAFTFTSIGSLPLKGKKTAVPICAVTRNGLPI